jgi:exosome complex component RRP43
VRRIEKSGGGGVGRHEMKGVVERAGDRWRQVKEALGTVG